MLGPVANLVFAVVVTLLASLMLRRKVGKRDRTVAVGFLIAVALVSFFAGPACCWPATARWGCSCRAGCFRRWDRG